MNNQSLFSLPKTLAKPFFITALGIVALHLILHPVRVLGMDTSIFYMDEKYTLTAFFSTVVTFLIGFLYVARSTFTNQKLSLVNKGIGVFFFILSFDEYFEVHEYINTLVKAMLKEGSTLGLLSSISWLFPLSLVVAGIFALFTIKLKREQNQEIRKAFLYGITCFVIVILFELLGSLLYGRWIYIYAVAIEEGSEMLSTCFFLYAALLEYTGQTTKSN